VAVPYAALGDGYSGGAVARRRDRAGAEVAWRASEAAPAALGRQLADCEALLEAEQSSRLAHLQRAFALDPAERDLLQLCLAHALDSGLAAILRHLAGEAAATLPTGRLAARLFAAERPTLDDFFRRVRQREPVVLDEDPAVTIRKLRGPMP